MARIRYGYVSISAFMLLAALFFLGPTRAAWACSCATCTCFSSQQSVIEELVTELHEQTRDHFLGEMQDYEMWFVEDYFYENILPAMMRAVEQLSAVGLNQIMILGALLDAKNQQETTRLFRQMAAEAHKSYYPSEGICTVGSSVRHLAAAEQRGNLNAMVMTQRSTERQLSNVNTAAAMGEGQDIRSRVEQYRRVYCDPNDNTGTMGVICTQAGNNAIIPRRNKDINYTKTLESPLTLNIDFSNNAITSDEEDILAMGSLLYANETVNPITDTLTANIDAKKREAAIEVYQGLRSIAAKRNIAENSYRSLVAMKASSTGAANNGAYVRGILQEMGISAADAQTMVGTNPSYYAAMELLTKDMLQQAEFYTNLYDKPTNVTRKGLALQALSLIQDWDEMKSNLRSEAALSILLEMEILKVQDGLQSKIDTLRETDGN